MQYSAPTFLELFHKFKKLLLVKEFRFFLYFFDVLLIVGPVTTMKSGLNMR